MIKTKQELKEKTIAWLNDRFGEGHTFNYQLMRDYLEFLKSQGMVLKVKRDLPELKKLEGEATPKEKMAYLSGVEDYRDMLKETRFTSYEELI